jgi:nitrite reductase/ring-hydroxylating ferredoxin subunit
MSEDARPGDEAGITITRRHAVGAGIIGLAVTVTGCSNGNGAGGGPASQSASKSAGAGALAKTTDIPVGGGMIFKNEQVVVTQPAAGEFKAFSAVCTHQGCIVSTVSNGTINCPCHGSKFKIGDGSVARGPASQALPSQAITVAGTEIKLA